jgi:hypothetical protein
MTQIITKSFQIETITQVISPTEHVSLVRGAPLRVRKHEKDEWTHAHFDSFDPKGRVLVIANGRTPWTALSINGKQMHELTQHDLDWGDGVCETNLYYYFEIPELLPMPSLVDSHQAYISHMNEATANGMVISKAEIEQISALKRGDNVQVRYNENNNWQNAHFDMFWTDGRIQTIPNGRSPWSELSADGKQHHQIEDPSTEAGFGHATSNFYRMEQEVTNSGDLRDTTAYIKHWS